MNNSNKTLAIAAIAALLIATVAITTDSAFAKKYKKTQTTAQENACGNGPLPLNIFCSNAGSQVQGRDNDVSVTTSQPSIATGNSTAGL
jgi:methionine-rich copper-binding protein CopC